MRKMYLVIFTAIVCVLFVGCVTKQKALPIDKGNAEGNEITEGLNEIDDLDTFPNEINDSSFKELEELDLE